MSIAAEVYEADRRALWGLCYRMTGSAADADDIVQETFVRAIQRPPRRTNESLRPWLMRVATNLSLDHLRRRKRRDYRGPWLPSPLPTDEMETAITAPVSDSPAARYDLRESVSFAFLLALEALTPMQRAVLLLRDVLDYSTEETAAALHLSEANVKVHLHRARRRLDTYDKERFKPDSLRAAATQEAIERFLSCLNRGDVECLEKLLTEDAVSLSDGGGKVYAALNPIYGRSKVARLIAGLNEKLKLHLRIAFRNLNGLPALVVEHPAAPDGIAPLFTMHFEIDSEGKIRRLSTVLAPDKLTALNELGYSNSDK